MCGFALRTLLNAQTQAIADAAAAAAAAAVLAANQSLTAAGGLTINSSFDRNQSDIGANVIPGATPTGNSSSTAGSNVTLVFVDTGGPSCRPLPLLDLRTGVVNEGC